MRHESRILTFDEFADELLQEQQPRALVILASARIDYQIRSLLEEFLWPKANKPKEQDEMLDGENPLSAFSSRIKMCRRLGLVDERLGDSLHKLREIRNQAAHWISFGVTESPLKDQLKHLNALTVSRRSYRLTVTKFFDSPNLTDFQSLQAVLLTLSVLIESIRAGLTGKSLPKVQKHPKID
jgi:hypothetical protein